LEHLLSVWPKILDQTRNAKHILFLTDFDGTLTPIVEKPEMAVLSEKTRELLQALATQRHFTVGIISGRALVDLKDKVDIRNIVYAGNHGFEIEGPGISFINPIADEIRPFFRIMRQVLMLTLQSIKGVFVEDKGITLSVHYRHVDEEKVEDVEKMVRQAIDGPITRGIFKVTHGKKVYEVKPAANWDKGKAIRLLMKRFGKGGRQSGLLPIYLGDDLTDEDGFNVIEKYGHGISIYVGGLHNKSAARYYLTSPDEVVQFLGELLSYAQRGLLCRQHLTTS
jgi:trehalose 6-phosphate phosphatase